MPAKLPGDGEQFSAGDELPASGGDGRQPDEDRAEVSHGHAAETLFELSCESRRPRRGSARVQRPASKWTGRSVRTARVHDARHTAATLLLEQGIGIRVIQQILGHSQLSQTQRYTHVTATFSQDAADRMSEALWG